MEDVILRQVWVNGPVIVGAGPSGLAVAACLRKQNVPFVILEKADCIASLWNNRTYNRLKLHLPKRFCQLPHLKFPNDFPEYPSKYQFISYLESYAKFFNINPNFSETASSAAYDYQMKRWRVEAASANGTVEYFSTWLVVATGENAENKMPEFEGLQDFTREVIHASEYKSGEPYEGKRVVVVGCGNTGMEVSLDLCNFKAKPLMVVRNPVHVLPRDIFGKSTYELVFLLANWLPLSLLDKLFLLLARLILGDVEKYGLRRPRMGPLQLKETEGRTPVLDIGTLEKIKSREIQIVPGIKRFTKETIEFVDEQVYDVDAVIFATGYRSNVPKWLQEREFFAENGIPRVPFPNGWKGKDGIYAVGFSKKGIYGVSLDSVRIAQDISSNWRRQIKNHTKIAHVA